MLADKLSEAASWLAHISIRTSEINVDMVLGRENYQGYELSLQPSDAQQL